MAFLITTTQPNGLLYGMCCADGEILLTPSKKDASRFTDTDADALVKAINKYASVPWEVVGVRDEPATPAE